MALNPFSLVRPLTVNDSGTFTRNSVGTYLGKDGFLKVATANEPRFQYDASGVPQGLLYEAAASNYFKNTNNLADATNWGVITGWTGAADTLAGPDGLLVADGRVMKFTAGASPTVGFLRQLNFLGTAGTYAISLYVYVPTQSGVTNWAILCDAQDIDSSNTSQAYTTFDKWVRVPVTITLGASRTWLDFNLYLNGVAPTTGKIAYVAFPQCEPGTAMTSYFPNSSTSAIGTRAADLLSGMVSNVPEPTSNRLAMSEQFDQAVWGKGNLSVTADATTAPLTVSGPFSTGVLSNADALIPTNVSSNAHEVHQDSGISVGAVACLSGYFKAGAYSGVVLRLGNAALTTFVDVSVDLSTGLASAVFTSGGAVLVGYGVQSVGNGWYRAWVAGYGNPVSGGAYRCFALVYPTGAGAAAYSIFTGDNASGLYAWGMQLTPGPYAHGYMGSQSLVNVNSTDAPTWNGATAYALGNQVSRIQTGLHNIYQRLIAGTTATAPESDTANWVLVSTTNKWKMFDLVNETQTWFFDDIQIAYMPSAMCDTVIFDNLNCDSVRCFTANGAYDQTIATKVRACANWFQYFFEQFTYKKGAAFTKLPLVTTNLINVIARKATSYPMVGTLLAGFSRAMGYAEPGANVGIIDYSTKSTDQFGNTSVVKRAYSKRMNLAVMIDNADLDSVEDLLAGYRATPVGWLGAGNQYTSLIIFGFYKSFDIVIAYPTQSRCNLEIEGLT